MTDTILATADALTRIDDAGYGDVLEAELLGIARTQPADPRDALPIGRRMLMELDARRVARLTGVAEADVMTELMEREGATRSAKVRAAIERVAAMHQRPAAGSDGSPADTGGQTVRVRRTRRGRRHAG